MPTCVYIYIYLYSGEAGCLGAGSSWTLGLISTSCDHRYSFCVLSLWAVCGADVPLAVSLCGP